MSAVKLAVVSSLAALALGGCGAVQVKPSSAPGKAASRGRVDHPDTSDPNYVACLRAHGLAVHEVGVGELQIGTPPLGPRIYFAPTPGIAQGYQLMGKEQGAEVINDALLYPDGASDSELSDVESCLDTG